MSTGGLAQPVWSPCIYLEEGDAVVDLVHAGEEDEHVAGRLHRVQPQHGIHAALDVVGARLFSVQ